MAQRAMFRDVNAPSPQLSAWRPSGDRYYAQNNQHDKKQSHCQDHEEYDLGRPSGARGDACEAKCSGDNRYDNKNDLKFEHLFIPALLCVFNITAGVLRRLTLAATRAKSRRSVAVPMLAR